MARMTSGAIQYGVPTNELAGLEMEADPKSANLMQPLSVSKMLPALMSRWIWKEEIRKKNVFYNLKNTFFLKESFESKFVM